MKLSYKNSSPAKSKRRNYSVWDPEQEPGYIFTTFKSYKELADVYGKRAIPKAQVTEQITKLSNEIVGNEKDTKEQVKLLYEWVGKNITYKGNCIGVGAVVPRDIDVVLKNKIGDCKDHATLLQALLASKNIKSTQALVNASSEYKLRSLPTADSVNHVINYIPSLDLYLDSTNGNIPFDMLPMTVSDKPVLLVENYKEGTKTPPISADQNVQTTIININIII
ncbi:MAG: transglutaminase domain-containing protein [Bacteroidetes bacterium]|nr:transglutaminase domain-containing protein [Bacteroidota bacterium]